jgi:hypothetical protein
MKLEKTIDYKKLIKNNLELNDKVYQFILDGLILVGVIREIGNDYLLISQRTNNSAQAVIPISDKLIIADHTYTIVR